MKYFPKVLGLKAHSFEIRIIVSKIPPLSFGIFGWRSQPRWHMGLARSAKLSRIRIIVCFKIVNDFLLMFSMFLLSSLKKTTSNFSALQVW